MRVVYDDAIYFGVLTKDDQPSVLTIIDIKDFNAKQDAQIANKAARTTLIAKMT